MGMLEDTSHQVNLKDLRIGVFRGGLSCERDISLLSGQNVLNALKARDYKVVDVDLKTKDKKEIVSIIRDNSIDIAFIALHGEFGEDGGIQRILEDNSIAFSGAGSKASLASMDKIESRRILLRNNIPMPEYWIEDEGLPKFQRTDYPLVVKPHSAGSSMGVSLIKNKSLLPKAIDEARKYGRRVIVERYIKGRELTVGILGQKPLPVVEMVFKKEFFDFSSKYEDELTEFIVPAGIPAGLAQDVQELAFKVFCLLGCRHLGRVDLRVDQDLNPFVLELNSIPGLTVHSLLPLAARSRDISFEDLCEDILRQVVRDFRGSAIYEESTQKKD